MTERVLECPLTKARYSSVERTIGIPQVFVVLNPPIISWHFQVHRLCDSLSALSSNEFVLLSIQLCIYADRLVPRVLRWSANSYKDLCAAIKNIEC
jgi:hypothetical protein